MESLKLKNDKYWDTSGVFDHEQLKTQEEINAIFKNEFNEVVTGTSIGPIPIATFDASAADMPLKGLTANIGPVQDLHSYDHPWPEGGGKNLLKYPYETGTVTKNGVTFTVYNDGSIKVDTAGAAATANADLYFFSSTGSLPLSNGDYIFSSTYDGTLPSDGFYIHAKANASDASYLNIGIGDEGLYTVSNGVFYTACIRVLSGRTINNVTVRPMLRLATETDATFEPYSNICPITGWTGCNIVATKNIFDIDNATWVHRYLIAADGTITENSRYKYCSNYTPIIGGRKITVSCTRTSTQAAFGTPISFYDDQKTFLSRISTFSANGVGGYVQVTIDVPEDAAFFRLNCYDVTTPVSDFQIEYGDTATDFSPFSSFDVTFPSEAGTVYGGTLDVTTGVLEVKYIKFTFTPDLQYANNSDRANAFSVYVLLPSCAKGQLNMYCNCLKVQQNARDAVVPATQISSSLLSAIIAFPKTIVSSYDDIRTKITELYNSGTPIEIVYQIDQPIVYQLTLQEVTTLLGTNNIWADTGDVTVTYGAYLETIKAYADKVGDSILSAIAPLETSYIATRGYAVGTYLFVGTKFYKVKSAIAKGGTITPGTNVFQTTVAMQLIAHSRDIATLVEMYNDLYERIN